MYDAEYVLGKRRAEHQVSSEGEGGRWVIFSHYCKHQHVPQGRVANEHQPTGDILLKDKWWDSARVRPRGRYGTRTLFALRVDGLRAGRVHRFSYAAIMAFPMYVSF